MTTDRSLQQVVAVWNPAAGSAPDPDELRERLGEDVELVETTEDDPGPGQTRQAVADGATIVAVCGGDGTIRACASELVGTETALALVPMGTGNLLGANLGVPGGLDAVELLHGEPGRRTIDVGRANGEAFLVMAGTGYDADMIGGADSSAKAKLGSLAYVGSALRNLRRPRTHTVVEIDGRRFFAGPASMVLVGNFGSVTGGIDVFPGAAPDDGRLEVLVTRTRTRTDWVRFAWNLLRGRTPVNLARRGSGRRIDVRLDDAQPWELDGETREATSELTFEVEPSALDVLIPGADDE